MATGKLNVQFGSLDGASADISGSAGNIQARLDQLTHDLQPLRSDWTGSASEAYQQAKAKWDSGMDDIRQLLADIGRQVASSNGDYQSTENQNTHRWG